jgi:hypothetical protein
MLDSDEASISNDVRTITKECKIFVTDGADRLGGF